MSNTTTQADFYTLEDIAKKVKLSKSTMKRYAPYIPGRKQINKRVIRYSIVLVDQWIDEGMPTPQLRIAS